jgi:hypothetical protein
VRALLIFVLVVAVASLVMFALYAAMDISHSVGGLALLVFVTLMGAVGSLIRGRAWRRVLPR